MAEKGRCAICGWRGPVKRDGTIGAHKSGNPNDWYRVGSKGSYVTNGPPSYCRGEAYAAEPDDAQNATRGAESLSGARGTEPASVEAG